MTDSTDPAASEPGPAPAEDTPDPALLPNGMPRIITARFDHRTQIKRNIGTH